MKNDEFYVGYLPRAPEKLAAAVRQIVLAFVALGYTLAIVLVFAGSTFLEAPLNPREHPLGFLLFWIVCGWLTLAALLLGIFDLLMVKLEARKSERSLREKFVQSDNLERSTTRTVGSEHANRFGARKQSRLGK